MLSTPFSVSNTLVSTFTKGSIESSMLPMELIVELLIASKFSFVIAQVYYPGLLYVSIKLSIPHHPLRMLDARGQVIGCPSSPPMRCTFQITSRTSSDLAHGCHIVST